jgi:hypothetical protein
MLGMGRIFQKHFVAVQAASRDQGVGEGRFHLMTPTGLPNNGAMMADMDRKDQANDTEHSPQARGS